VYTVASLPLPILSVGCQDPNVTEEVRTIVKGDSWNRHQIPHIGFLMVVLCYWLSLHCSIRAVTGLLLASTIVLPQRASVPAQAFSETITLQLRSISQARLQVFGMQSAMNNNKIENRMDLIK